MHNCQTCILSFWNYDPFDQQQYRTHVQWWFYVHIRLKITINAIMLSILRCVVSVCVILILLSLSIFFQLYFLSKNVLIAATSFLFLLFQFIVYTRKTTNNIDKLFMVSWTVFQKLGGRRCIPVLRFMSFRCMCEMLISTNAFLPVLNKLRAPSSDFWLKYLQFYCGITVSISFFFLLFSLIFFTLEQLTIRLPCYCNMKE